MGSKNIRGLASPVEDSDAATKQYVDNTIQSVASVLDTCFVATTANLTGTYDTSAGTLIATLNDALPNIDTVASSSFIEKDAANNIQGTRILVKDQSAAVQNGIYEVVKKGSNSTQWELLRTSDFTNGFEASGSFIYVEDGAQNKGNGFICNNDSNADTVNTNDISFVKFSGAGEIVAGAGLSLSGNTLSINVKPAQINDPDNAGSQIDNPDRFIFIDEHDRLDANISNLVTALNTNGGITASSADTFDWPATAINDISTIDQLVILDKVAAGTDVIKHVSIGNIKNHILGFNNSADIQYLNDTNNPNTLKIKPAAVDNTHLNKSVITGQTILEDNDSNEVKPSADDLILISDHSDNGDLKKVKYSKFVSGLSATPDFSGTGLLAENDLALDDKVLVLDSTDGNSLHHLPFSRVARKFVTLDGSNNNISLQANNPTILDPGYTYYYKLAGGASSSSTRYVELNSTANEHDTIEIIVLSPKTSDGEDDGNLTDKKLSIKLSDSKTVEYNFSDFPKDNHYIFVYIDGMWITKPKVLDRKVSPRQIIKSAAEFNNMMQGSSLEPLRFKYKNYYISSTAESITLTLPTATSVLNDDDIMPGDSIRVYFMHKNVTKTVTLLTGDESIFHKLVGTNSARANDFLVTKKEISFNIKESADADMPYIDITFKSIFDNDSTNLALSIKHTGWLISSPYNAANSDPAFSLPAGATNQVLKYTGTNTTAPGKIEGVNITKGAITGGVTGAGNNATASGSIALNTIVGANITSNTVTKDKLAQVNNYKVLGSLNNDTNAPSNNDVAEVNVIKDLSVNILAADQHNSIATAQAIKNLIGTQPIVNPIDQILYIGNQNDTDFATFPQRYEIPDSLSSANINLNLLLRNQAVKANKRSVVREMNDIANMSSNSVDVYQGANGVDDEDSRNFYKLEFKSRSNKPLFDANGDSIPLNDRVNLPWYYNTSDLRLPSSEYWYNTYGPETPVKIKITFTADSSLNVPIGEQMNDYVSYSARLGLNSLQKNRFRSLWRNSKFYILKILPNSNDVNAKSDYQGLTTALSDINLKSGTPTYVVDAYTPTNGVPNYGTQLFALQDGTDISSQNKVMSYSQGNFIGINFSDNSEERTIKAYVRKYGQTKQRTAGGGTNWPQTSILTIPESYVWHITIA